MAGKSFPARTVIASYHVLEAKLSEVLNVIPYCPEHLAVWSPVLPPLLLDAGSQLDSLWKSQSRLSRLTAKNLNIESYFSYYANTVAPRWVTFWGQDEPAELMPFKAWNGATKYVTLPWWNAYNGVKHNRLADRKLATIENAVAAVAGVFIAILKCNPCLDEIAQTNWLTSKLPDPASYLGKESPSIGGAFVAAETHLFTYAVGWSDKKIVAGDIWDSMAASKRFKRWFDRQGK